jgi:hypothetical protein
MKSQLVFAVHTTLPLPPVQPPRDDRMLRIPPPFSSGIRLTTATHTRTNVCLDAQVGFDARNLTTTSGGTIPRGSDDASELNPRIGAVTAHPMPPYSQVRTAVLLGVTAECLGLGPRRCGDVVRDDFGCGVHRREWRSAGFA